LIIYLFINVRHKVSREEDAAAGIHVSVLTCALEYLLEGWIAHNLDTIGLELDARSKTSGNRSARTSFIFS
jgi:hypothetical protein